MTSLFSRKTTKNRRFYLFFYLLINSDSRTVGQNNFHKFTPFVLTLYTLYTIVTEMSIDFLKII